MNGQTKKKTRLQQTWERMLRQQEMREKPYQFISPESDTLWFKTPNERALYRSRIEKLSSPGSKLDVMKDQNLLNLATQPTREDSLMYDRLHPGEKSIFPEKEKYDFKKAREQRYAYLVSKASKGQASQEELNELARLRQYKYAPKEGKKGKSSSDKQKEYINRMKEAENILSATKKEGTEWDAPIVPKYSEDLRDIAKQTQAAYADSVFFLREADRLQKSGLDITPGQLSRTVAEGTAIASELMNQWQNGELDVPREELEAMINERLKPLNMDLDDVIYFSRKGK